MAYLFKHTPLQTNFAVNLTCLVPTENAEAGRPERLDLKQMLWHFLHFRLDVVTSRLEHELEQLTKRIHILEGFEKVFDALDEIIAHHPQVRRQGRRRREDHQALRARRGADRRHPRAEALPPGPARDPGHPERAEGEARRAPGRSTRCSRTTTARWRLVREELEQIQKAYGDSRRTAIEQADETEYAAEAFIVDEDNVVIVSRDGWVKRQKEVKDLSTTRLREGDSVLAAVAGSTRVDGGVLHQLRRGLHRPLRRRAGLDRLRRAGAAALQVQGQRAGGGGRSASTRGRSATSAVPTTAATTSRRRSPTPRCRCRRCTRWPCRSDGYSLRFSLANVAEPSTRAGRRYARPAEGAEVVGVSVVTGAETVIAATRDARAMLCPASDVNFLAGPGKGVILIKIGDDDRVLGFVASTGDRDLLTVETSRGAEQTVSTAKYEVTGTRRQGPRTAAARAVHPRRVHAGRATRVE